MSDGQHISLCRQIGVGGRWRQWRAAVVRQIWSRRRVRVINIIEKSITVTIITARTLYRSGRYYGNARSLMVDRRVRRTMSDGDEGERRHRQVSRSAARQRSVPTAGISSDRH